jgi:hypothetical protein
VHRTASSPETTVEAKPLPPPPSPPPQPPAPKPVAPPAPTPEELKARAAKEAAEKEAVAAAEEAVTRADSLIDNDSEREAVAVLEVAYAQARVPAAREIVAKKRAAIYARLADQVEKDSQRIKELADKGEYAQARSIVGGLRSRLPRSFERKLDALDAAVADAGRDKRLADILELLRKLTKEMEKQQGQGKSKE